MFDKNYEKTVEIKKNKAVMSAFNTNIAHTLKFLRTN